MKIVKRIFWFSLLALFLFAGIRILIGAIQEESYAIEMQDLNVKAAKGSLIAGYDVASEQFTRKYIPKEVLAKKQEDVGYLVKITYSKTGAAYSGGHYVSGTAIHTEFVDCDTGKILFEHDFEPYFPQTVSTKTKSVSVDPDVVERWITHVYPHWPADKDVGHDYGPDGCWFCGQLPGASAGTEAHVWADATCTAPKTCQDCGATEGKALGHNFMPTVCTRCGMEAGGQKKETPAETQSAQQDPESHMKSMITGQWKLDFVMDAQTMDMVSTEGEVKLQINKDFSAFINTPDGRYSYDLVFNFADYEDNDPDKYIYYFLLIDDSGNELFCGYYYDNSIGIYTDAYSVFFIR